MAEKYDDQYTSKSRSAAERQIAGILSGILQELDPHTENLSEEGRKQAYQAAAYGMARSFMTPKGQDPEADADREAAIMLAHAMNPRTPDYQDQGIYAALDKYNKHFPDLGSLSRHVRNKGYSGAGWTEREEKELGIKPSRTELSPGDLMEYQRRLDAYALTEIAKAQDKWSSNQESADPAVNDGLLNQRLQQIGITHEGAKGERYAFGLMGSKYPWHQGLSAVSDAMTSHASPIGNFIQKGIFQSNAAANAFMSKEDPLAQAATEYESNYLWGPPSPRGAPDLPPKERDAFLEARRKEANALRPHDYSTYAWAKNGSPPSYYGQGALNFANALADISTPVSVLSTKPLNYVMKAAAANTRIPMLTRYMGHIANKTAAGASAPLLPTLKSEAIQDLYPMSAMQAGTTYMENKTPGFFQGFLPGKENRPDLEGFDTDSVREHVAQKDEDASRAMKSAAEHNNRHPEAFSRISPWNPGAVIGDAVGTQMAKPIEKKPPGWFNLFQNALIAR